MVEFMGMGPVPYIIAAIFILMCAIIAVLLVDSLAERVEQYFMPTEPVYYNADGKPVPLLQGSTLAEAYNQGYQQALEDMQYLSEEVVEVSWEDGESPRT